jgi:DNA-binding IclR family transcriptional regulator
VAQRASPTTAPAVWSPGEYLVIDWAQAVPGLVLFCAVLVFSRWRLVAFAVSRSFHAFFTTADPEVLDTIAADKTHRHHAVIEQVHADLAQSVDRGLAASTPPGCPRVGGPGCRSAARPTPSPGMSVTAPPIDP